MRRGSALATVGVVLTLAVLVSTVLLTRQTVPKGAHSKHVTVSDSLPGVTLFEREALQTDSSARALVETLNQSTEPLPVRESASESPQADDSVLVSLRSTDLLDGYSAKLHLFESNEVRFGNSDSTVECDGSWQAHVRREVLRQAPHVLGEVEGYGSTGVVTVGKSEVAEITHLELFVVPYAIISGVAIDSAGLPLIDTRVVCSVDAWVLGGPQPRSLQTLRTNHTGRFVARLDAVGARFRFAAVVEEKRSAEVAVQPSAGERIEITLPFQQPLHVSGIVIAPDGTPVAQSRLTVAVVDDCWSTTGWDFQASLLTNSSGRFDWNAPRTANYEIFADPDKWCSSEPHCVWLDGTVPAEHITLQLLQGTSITGQIHWADGSPIGGIVIAALPERDAPTSLAQRRSVTRFGIHKAVTGSDGTFHISPVRLGEETYALSTVPDAEHPNCVCRWDGIAAGATDIQLNVDRATFCGAAVVGSVRTEDTGDPLPQLFVDLYRRDGVDWSLITSGEFSNFSGAFHFEGLEAGKNYAITVLNAAGFMPVLVPEWTVVGDKSFDLLMLRPRDVKLHLLSPSGSVVTSGRVEMTAGDDHPGRAGFLMRPIDRDGSSSLQLWPGQYSLNVVDGDRRWTAGVVEIDNLGEPRELVVRLN